MKFSTCVKGTKGRGGVHRHVFLVRGFKAAMPVWLIMRTTDKNVENLLNLSTLATGRRILSTKQEAVFPVPCAFPFFDTWFYKMKFVISTMVLLTRHFPLTHVFRITSVLSGLYLIHPFKGSVLLIFPYGLRQTHTGQNLQNHSRNHYLYAKKKYCF